MPVAIGNGLHAMTTRRESLMDEYRRKQRECAHAKRDPGGTCYACGQEIQHEPMNAGYGAAKWWEEEEGL